MSLRAVQAKKSNGAPGGMAKVLPDTMTRTAYRHDKYERQADEASLRMMRGETNVARHLSPAVAASYRLPTSAGDPLSGELRVWLERGFGADLAAVRIHRDHPATVATHARYADAFAAGRNIYVRPDRFDPGSPASSALMAHEVAHVLQQTGRAGTNGRMQVSGAEGAGEVQYKPSTAIKPASPAPDFDTICRLHGDANPHDAMLKTAITQTKKKRQEALASQQETSFLDERESSAKNLKAGGPTVRNTAGFLYDVLKSGRRFEGAAALLGQDRLLRTASFSAELYENTSGDLSFMDFFLLTSSFFKNFPPRRFSESIAEYLFGPTQRIPNLGVAKDFRIEAKKSLGSIDSPQGLIDNELMIITVWAVDQADQFRIKKLTELAREVAPGIALDKLGPPERASLARKFAKWGRKVSDDPSEFSSLGIEPAQILKAALPAMVDTAENAANFWEKLALLDIAIRQGGAGGQAGRGLIERVASRPEFVHFAQRVLHQARAFFALTPFEQKKLQLPSAAEHAKRRDAFVNQLLLDSKNDFELKLLAGLEAGKVNLDNGLLIAYGWMLLRTHYLIKTLQDYVAQNDTASLDFEIHHRLQIAGNLWDWAQMAPGWTELGRLAQQVADGEQEGQKQSFISLRSEWEDDHAKLSQLDDDFPNRPIPGWEPLTAHELMSFFAAGYDRYFALEIEKRLSVEKANYDTTKDALLIRAQDAAKGFELPTRYIVEDVDYMIRPADREHFDDVVAAHPKTIALLESKRQPGASFDPLHLIPAKPGTVFLWIFPDFVELIQQLQGIDDFNRAIYRSRLPKGAAIPADPNLGPIQDMEPEAWWNALRKAIEKFKGQGEDLLQGQQELNLTLANDRKAFRDTLEADMQTASILDRSMRVVQRYRPLLEAYQRYSQFERRDVDTPQGKRKILGYEIPNFILDEIPLVIAKTGPARYQPYHQAALIFELADLLQKKLSVNPRTDVVVGFLPLLDDALKTAKDNPAMLNDVLTEEDKKTPDWLQQRIKNTSELAEVLRNITLHKQLEFGFAGFKAADGDVVIGVGQGYSIKAGESFTIGGLFESGATTYRLKRVVENFFYYPAFGPTKPKVVLADSNGDPVHELTESEKTGKVLLEMEMSGERDDDGNPKGGKLYKITADDAATLARLSFAITMEGLIRQLQDLAAFIQGVAEWTEEAIELLPGVGQIAMGAHLAVSIVEFLASPEFQVLKDELFHDPGKIVRRGIDVLEGLFNPLVLWEYLLFAANPFDRLHDVDSDPPAGKLIKQSSSGIGGRIKAILISIYHMGKRLLGFTGRLQTKVRWKAESIQYWVLEKPLLAAFLGFVANHIDEIAQIVEGAVDVGARAADAKADIENKLEQWPDQVISLVDHLRQLELPKEIIPMWQVYAIITDLVLSRLGAKFRIAGKAIMFLLQKTGKDQVVFSAINDAIKSVDEDLDLNTLWQTLVVSKLEPPLKEARETMAVNAFDLFAQIPYLSKATQQKFTAAKSSVQAGKDGVKPQLVEDDELQPAPLPGAQTARAVALPRESGTPMAPAALHSAQSRFGHNFSHVRVHDTPAAHRATAQAHAAALTSGSNIYLGSGVKSGSETFDHELTHVLQQAGPRQLGQRHDLAPVRGRSNVGLRFDPASESAAQRTAGQVRQGRATRPIDPGPTAKPGPQPTFLVDVTRRFLEDLSKTGGAEHTEERADRAHLRETPENVRNQVAEVWGTFQTALKTIEAKGSFADTKKNMPNEIQKYLISRSKDDGAIGEGIEKEIGALAGDAMDEVKAEKGSKKKSVTYKLDPARFRIVLERYILGKSGIALTIKFADQGAGEGAREEPVKVEKVTVEFVYLQIIHGGSNLWQLAVKDLLPDPKERTKWLPRLRTHLAGRGATPGIWKPNEYSLRDSVLEDTKKELAGATLIEAKDLPPPADYLAPTGVAKSGLGQVGLRLGTYAEKGKGGNQNGTERESHHITQFLLMEYFSNKSDPHAFKLLKAGSNPYPGLNVASGQPTVFSRGGSSVKIQDFYTGRGGRMPAILLGRTTHRTAGLHVTSTADDFDDSVDSPGAAVDAVFKEHLGSVYSDSEKDPDTFRKYKAAKGEAVVQENIYSAMQETYKWMKNFMQPRLKDGLERVETKYYNDLAAQVSGPTINAAEAASVWTFAVAHNKTKMAEAGFKD
jgi:Domain of unknown function (DUF4157)/Novel toxin 14